MKPCMDVRPFLQVSPCSHLPLFFLFSPGYVALGFYVWSIVTNSLPVPTLMITAYLAQDALLRDTGPQYLRGGSSVSGRHYRRKLTILGAEKAEPAAEGGRLAHDTRSGRHITTSGAAMYRG